MLNFVFLAVVVVLCSAIILLFIDAYDKMSQGRLDGIPLVYGEELCVQSWENEKAWYAGASSATHIKVKYLYKLCLSSGAEIEMIGFAWAPRVDVFRPREKR